MKKKKINYKFVKILIIALFFPNYIFYNFIKFINKKKLRLYEISDIIGNSSYVELYLSERLTNLHKEYYDVFFLESSFSILVLRSSRFNYFWSITLLNNCNNSKIKNRFILFIFSFYWQMTNKYLKIINQFSFINEFTNVPIYTHSQITKNIINKSNILKNKNSLFIIDKKNHNICEDEYKKIEEEFKINRPIVAILNRDSAYKDFTHPKRNWTYHNYRNAKITDFVDASEYLIEEGYFVIRHGNKSLEELEIKSKYFFDYSKSKFRSAHMDIYLIMKSSFYLVVAGTGPWTIASYFNIPMGHVNWVHLKYLPTYSGKSIFIPKKIFDIKENKFLPFSKYLDPNYRKSKITNLPLGLWTHTEDYENGEIKLIDNSPSEILQLSREMNLFTNNKLHLEEEDNKLQKNFWSIFNSDFPYSENNLISPAFLRNNKSLLE